jgi:hypothetical protein
VAVRTSPLKPGKKVTVSAAAYPFSPGRSKTAVPSEELAGLLGAALGREFTPAAARKALQRAREKFAELLLDEVAGGVADPTPDRVVDELATVGLLAHCREALRQRYGV